MHGRGPAQRPPHGQLRRVEAQLDFSLEAGRGSLAAPSTIAPSLAGTRRSWKERGVRRRRDGVVGSLGPARFRDRDEDLLPRANEIDPHGATGLHPLQLAPPASAVGDVVAADANDDVALGDRGAIGGPARPHAATTAPPVVAGQPQAACRGRASDPRATDRSLATEIGRRRFVRRFGSASRFSSPTVTLTASAASCCASTFTGTAGARPRADDHVDQVRGRSRPCGR